MANNSFKTVSEIVASLRSQLGKSPKQALKALVILFNRQTEDEKAMELTRHANNVGFNHNDSKILTSIAKQYLKGYTLSDKQMAVLMRLVPKYARQLVLRAIDLGTYKKVNGRWVY
jgi:exopolyphosphatase/pppGpp-phosphohydrolase